MFYEICQTRIFKVFGFVTYFIIEKYINVDYLCSQKNLISLTNKGFENTTFDDNSGIGIPAVLMNIMYCNGFSKENNANVILMCCGKMVPNQLSKCF